MKRNREVRRGMTGCDCRDIEHHRSLAHSSSLAHHHSHHHHRSLAHMSCSTVPASNASPVVECHLQGNRLMYSSMYSDEADKTAMHDVGDPPPRVIVCAPRPLPPPSNFQPDAQCSLRLPHLDSSFPFAPRMLAYRVKADKGCRSEGFLHRSTAAACAPFPLSPNV